MNFIKLNKPNKTEKKYFFERFLKFGNPLLGKHLGVKYPCELCGQVFLRKNSRRSHQKKVHKLTFGPAKYKDIML